MSFSSVNSFIYKVPLVILKVYLQSMTVFIQPKTIKENRLSLIGDELYVTKRKEIDLRFYVFKYLSINNLDFDEERLNDGIFVITFR